MDEMGERGRRAAESLSRNPITKVPTNQDSSRGAARQEEGGLGFPIGRKELGLVGRAVDL